MLEPVLSNPWVRALGALLALAATAFLVYLLRPVLVPLFLAFLAAYVLDPVVDYFENRKIPRGVTIMALGLLALAALLSVPVLIVPGLVAQADHLIQSAGAGTGRANVWLNDVVARLPLDRLVRGLGWVAADAQHVDPLAVLRTRLGEMVHEQSVQFLKANAAGFMLAGQTAGAGLFSVFASLGNIVLQTILFFANFALFAFVAGYLLNDFDGVLAGGRKLIPPRYAKRTLDLFTKIDGQLRSVLRGQVTVCVCLGSMYAVGFLIAGLQTLAFVVAALGMVASFVPVLGVALVALVAVLLALLQYGLDWHVLVVLATVALAQFLEGNVLTPRVVGRQVGLSPVWVILAVLVFGNFLGFLGLLLAVPLAATLKVFVAEGLACYRASPVFEGGGDTPPSDGTAP